MKTRLLRSLAVGSLVLLGASHPAAITWGQPDGTEHPEVVAILFLRADGFFSCTGTLLTPTGVLTAGHCTEDEQGDANLGTWVRNDPPIDVAAEPTIRVQAWLQDLGSLRRQSRIPASTVSRSSEYVRRGSRAPG